jgi:hypothetical protein
MDFEKFKAQWNDPEFVASINRRFPEDPREIVRRMEKIDMRAQRWRNARRVLMKVSVGILLALATLRQYVSHSREARLQTAAFILIMAAIWALQMLDKKREKYREPQYWLDRVEFLKSEFERLGQNIRIDLLSSALLCIGVASVAMYAVPFLSAGLRFACCAVAAAAIAAILLYEYRRISDLKRMRNEVAADMEDPAQE